MNSVSREPGVPGWAARVERLPLDPWADAMQLGRQVAIIAVALAVSFAFGVAIVFVKPLFVYGAVIGVACAVAAVRWPYFGLIAYLFIYIMRVGELYPALAPLRLERLVGVLTLISLMLAQMRTRGRLEFDWSRQSKHAVFFLLAIFASIPLAFWRAGAMTTSIDYVKIIIFYYLVVQIIDNRKKFWVFFNCYLGLITYIAASSVWDYVKGSLLVAQGIDRAIGATSAGGGPNEMGATMACNIPIALLLFLDKRTGKWRPLCLVVLSLMVVTLVLTGSRSGLLGFLAAMSFLVWNTRHRIPLLILAAVLAVGGFSLLPEQYKGRYSTMTSSHLDGSSQARLQVWMKGLRMVVDRPLTGVGVGCFGTANALGYSSGSRRSFLQSHSLYVQVPAEIGLLGAVAFFGYIIFTMRFNLRLRRWLAQKQAESWRLEILVMRGMFTGFVALWITGIFGHSMNRITWYLFPAMVLALARIYLKGDAETDGSAVRKLLG